MRIKTEINKEHIYKLLALLLALLPIISLYKIPVVGGNPTTIIIYLTALIVMFFNIKDRIHFKAPVIMLLYLFYLAYAILTTRSNSPFGITSTVGFFITIFVVMLACQEDTIRKYYIIWIERLSIIMSLIVIAECALYYGFGISSDYRGYLLPFSNYFNDSTIEYIANPIAKMVFFGLFRPSALFLEPAHFTNFVLPGLVSLFLKSKRLVNWRTVLITCGMILTTSGMGIVMVAVCWLMAAVIKDKFSLKVLGRLMVLVVFGIVAIIVLYNFSDSFHTAVGRFLDKGNHNAIQGRLGTFSLFKELNPQSKILGMGFKNVPKYANGANKYYMTGISELFYCGGYVGGIIFFIIYVCAIIRCFIKKDRFTFQMMIIGLAMIISTTCFTTFAISKNIPLFFDDNEKFFSDDKQSNMNIKKMLSGGR